MQEYDGIPLPELPIDEVDWRHRGDYIRTRSSRRGPREFDVEPEWATEAALDERRKVARDTASKSGRAIRVVGWSDGARRVLTVLLVPKGHAGDGAWWGVNAWAANSRDARHYRWEG